MNVVEAKLGDKKTIDGQEFEFKAIENVGNCWVPFKEDLWTELERYFNMNGWSGPNIKIINKFYGSSEHFKIYKENDSTYNVIRCYTLKSHQYYYNPIQNKLTLRDLMEFLKNNATLERVQN